MVHDAANFREEGIVGVMKEREATAGLAFSYEREGEEKTGWGEGGKGERGKSGKG